MATIEGEDIQGLIIDNGTETSKAGFSSDDAPRAIFQSAFLDEKSKLESPLTRGIITNWEDMEKLWQHTFSNELRVTPENYPLLITEAPLNPKFTREKTIQTLFEAFNFPAIYMIMQPVLALYASGKTSGLIVDSGAGITHTVPIYEGYPIPYCIKALPVAGQDLTAYLEKLLRSRGFSFSQDLKVVNGIKEQACFVSFEVEDEGGPSLDKTYELPDGQNLVINSERFRCPETLFESGEHFSIQETAYRSIMKCDADIRKELYTNILLCGGNTMFPGFPERINKEMVVMAGSLSKVKITAPQERQKSVWIGGSILASLATFQQMWITRVEYEEAGPTIVHRKCF